MRACTNIFMISYMGGLGEERGSVIWYYYRAVSLDVHTSLPFLYLGFCRLGVGFQLAQKGIPITASAILPLRPSTVANDWSRASVRTVRTNHGSQCFMLDIVLPASSKTQAAVA